MYAGRDCIVQIGLETEYGELAIPTIVLEAKSFSINVVPEVLQSEALVGAAFPQGLTKGMSKVTGSMVVQVNPENIGLIIGLLCGVEAAPELEDGSSGAYAHRFTAVIGSTALKSFSIIAEKQVDVYGFSGCKIDKLKLEVDPTGYLLATIDFIGQQEQIDGVALGILTYSLLNPYNFTDAVVLKGVAGGTTGDDIGGSVKKITLDYMNDLEPDRYRATGNSYTSEIGRQGRSCTLALDCDNTPGINALRESNYKEGVLNSFRVRFTHESEIEAGYNYILSIAILYGGIITAPADVPDDKRLSIPLEIITTEGPNGNLQFTLIDANSSGYIL